MKMVLNLKAEPMRTVAAILAVAVSPFVSTPASAVQASVTADSGAGVGILVMAHGGTPEWDRAILESVAPLAAQTPTVVALGMADHAAMASALDSLARTGVERVAVVRLFISGASFLDQTNYFLGLSPEPPAPIAGHAGHGGGQGPATPGPIAHGLAIATHAEGLMGAAEVSQIVGQRAAEISSLPANESVLLIAHGMGAEHENEAVLEAMRDAADRMAPRGFARIGVATLREDWPEQREREEASIRTFVERESALGRRVLVIPYRLHGFGPYASVLEGESYEPGDALVPHPGVTEWIARTATRVSLSQGWGDPFAGDR